MMSATCRSPKIEDAAKHFRIALGDRAFPGLKIDGAANFLVGCKNVRRVVGLAGRQLQDLADDEFDGLGERRQNVDETAHDRRNDQRDAIGIGERIGLRQHGGENHDQDGDR